MKQPTKAIICAAGLGIRMLPQTKAMPKEMLPIIDKPSIQFIVEQIVAAGVKDIIIVTDNNKKALEDHFDRNDDLEVKLRSNGKVEYADEIQRISELANFIYIRQKGSPKGTARPVLNSRHLIGNDEPFFVFFADDFFAADIPWPVQLKDAYNKTGKSVISMIKTDDDGTKKYAIADIDDNNNSGNVFKIKSLIEKPGPEKVKSRFASVGGFLLTPEIFDLLAQEKVGVGGEIVLADSIAELVKKDEVYGCFIEGDWYDTGNPLSYAKTFIKMAIQDSRFGLEIKEYIKDIIK